MEELENIDDDCDRHGIAFVKTQVVHSVAEVTGRWYISCYGL